MSVAELSSSGDSGYQPGYDRASHDRAPLDRTPPQDVAAEQSVLGAMLLSKDAIADVVEVLRGNDFYRPAHELVYEAILDLYGRGEPADAVTVVAELTRRGELGRVGGPSYVHTLLSMVPTAANAGFYAQIVRERAILRRLVEAGTRIVQLGYAAEGGDADEIVDRAQAEIYGVTEKRASEDYAPLADIMEGALDEIEAIGSRGGQMVGVPTGFTDLDQLTNGLHSGQMIVIAARPAVGKSTLGLDIARSAAIKNQLTTVIFSLEMGRNEITMRLLSAEARVPLHHMRSGTMSEDDWNRLARRMGEVSGAPLFIDDSPNMSMMEIRAKCRRLKQRHDLKLVVIDYLQLMSSGKRVESRQQEVAEFSRALKLLAKELEVPVIAMSQLNRGPEQRTDKKPQMSDLRESGCLTADTRILRADTGAEVTLAELLESGQTDVPVWSLDDSLRYVRRHLTHVFSTGRKEVFRLRLASGKEVRATANHPFLTYDGWRQLGDLAPGARLAVPRHVPAPERRTEMSDAQVGRLVTELADGSSGVVPAAVHSLPKAQVADLLRALWSRAGTILAGHDESSGLVTLSVPTTTAGEAIARLLLRFGIASELRSEKDGGPAALAITGRDERRRFLQEIGVGPEQEASAAALLAQVRSSTRSVEGPGPELWDRVRSVLDEDLSLAAAIRQASFVEPTLRRARARQPMGVLAAVLDEEDLDVYAVNDVLWDEVASIRSEGVEEVYDATVVGTHNFVANGIAVHNSIEQDADMVILLHREELYEKESPRAGEADFIVAKHRNGPTATITVAFQGHYSRFVDMAQM